MHKNVTTIGHKVYYKDDGETVSHNFYFPKRPKYVTPNAWEIV